MPPNGYSFRFYISLAFTLSILLLGSVFSTIYYLQTKDIITDLTSKAFGFTVEETAQKTANLFERAEDLVSIVATHEITNLTQPSERRPHFNFLLQSFAKTKNISSLYIAFGDGDFYLVRRLNHEGVHDTFQNAPQTSRYLIQVAEKNTSMPAYGEFRYYDASLSLLSVEKKPAYGKFDPRIRHWYESAIKEKGAITADPYVFYTTKEIGTTIAQQAKSQSVVVAADISLSVLNRFLTDFKTTEKTKVALLTPGTGVIASVESHHYADQVSELTPDTPIRLPLLKDKVLEQTLFNQEQYQAKNQLVEMYSEGQNWLTMLRNIQLPNHVQYTLVVAIPTSELLIDATSLITQSMGWLVGVLLVFLSLTNIFAKYLTLPIYQFAKQLKAVSSFNFNASVDIHSNIKEVNLLSKTFSQMNTRLSDYMEMNRYLAQEEDLGKLQNNILEKTIQICHAQGGVLHLANYDDKLEPQVLIFNEKHIGQHQLETINIKTLHSKIDRSGKQNDLIQLHQKHNDFKAFIEKSGLAPLIAKKGLKLESLVLVPLTDRQQDLVGYLTLFMNHTLNQHQESFIQAISRNAAIAIETRQLIQSQEALFESFIKLLASAIDGKSRYTAEHCKRVPEIMKLLAQAADQSKEGPYADFELSKHGKQAIHVASWLHDCGKITTPEYVIDKATKLETIYDRIHEIRMRFELIKKDIELGYCQKIVDGGDENSLKAQCEKELKVIDEEFLLVASCNQGDVVMDEWTRQQLEQIGKRKWTRTLSDRVGISHLELARKLRSGINPELPVQEYLLADKEEHKILRELDCQTHQYHAMGYTIPQPELLYNRGELYSLQVHKGTLNEEERYKIKEHIIQTSMMLDALHFPKHLKNVPEIACGHHEKIDGSGYPKGLTGDELSPLAKMMAIADIFEALTSDDRPYKKPNTLSETLSIMARMRDENQIDSELFDIFIENGVYKEFAVKFLSDYQIDFVEKQDYLSVKAKSGLYRYHTKLN